MKIILNKALRHLKIPLLMTATWLVFLVALWGSRGIASGYPAFLLALAAGYVMWQRHARQGSRRAAIWSGVAMALALGP